MRQPCASNSLRLRTTSIQATCALLALLPVGTLPAAESPASAGPVARFEIGNISLFGAYYSSTLPNNGGFQAGAVNLPSDVSAGASISFDWRKFTERSTFSMNYTPSYTGRVRYSAVNSLNHSFSMTASRKLAPRWIFGFSTVAQFSTLEQSLFSPTTLSNVTSAKATFDELAAGLLTGTFTNNPQLGSVLSSAPIVESPVSHLIYGQRLFTAGARSSLSYSFSPRLSFTVSGGATRTQNLSGSDTPGSSYLLNDTTSIAGALGLSYSLSPVTQIGAEISTLRAISQLSDYYTTTAMFTVGRKWRNRWVVQAHSGISATNPVRSVSIVALAPNVGPAFGGSATYKTFQHSFSVSFDRSTFDSYGLGASANYVENASWRWRRIGRSWWVDSSLGWQQLQGNPLAEDSGWRTTAALSQVLGRRFILSTQYAYLNYSGAFQAAPYHVSQHAVRVSLIWDRHLQAVSR